MVVATLTLLLGVVGTAAGVVGAYAAVAQLNHLRGNAARSRVASQSVPPAEPVLAEVVDQERWAEPPERTLVGRARPDRKRQASDSRVVRRSWRLILVLFVSGVAEWLAIVIIGLSRGEPGADLQLIIALCGVVLVAPAAFLLYKGPSTTRMTLALVGVIAANPLTFYLAVILGSCVGQLVLLIFKPLRWIT
jgi:hypothetical protein